MGERASPFLQPCFSLVRIRCRATVAGSRFFEESILQFEALGGQSRLRSFEVGSLEKKDSIHVLSLRKKKKKRISAVTV